MAMTHDYMDYLNENIGISPANSQEEYQAAQTIVELMSRHDVDPQIEEFDAASASGLVTAILAVAMFLGVLFSGFGITTLAVVGFILALIPSLLALLRYFGYDLTASLGSSRSQNVVAFHEASGPLVEKGNRPIVVVAHYDSPHENFIYSSFLGSYLPTITKASTYCNYAVAVCALIQFLGFIPGVVRIVFWIVGIVAAIPSLLLGVSTIVERLSPCTIGANDNKASVAAMLGVLENVRPSGEKPKERKPQVVEEVESVRVVPAAKGEPSEEPADEEAVEEPVAEESVVGVRHGEEVMRALGILPANCALEYVGATAAVEQGPSPVRTVEVESAGEEVFESDLEDMQVPVDEEEVPEEPSVAEDLTQDVEAADAEDMSEALGSASQTASLRIHEERIPAEETSPNLAAAREELISSGRFSTTIEESRGVGEKDTTGLYTTDGSYDLDSTLTTKPVTREKPSAPDDPEWGKSNYRPQSSNFARRASLYDLPDPSNKEIDPFAGDGMESFPATDVDSGETTQQQYADDAQTMQNPVPPLDSQFGVIGAQDALDPVSTMGDDAEIEDEQPKRNVFRDLLDKIKGKLSRNDASEEEWSDAEYYEEGYEENYEEGDDFAEDSGENGDTTWRGGAAPRSGLRFVDEEEAPTEDELRDAVLSIGDDALICHDIWFVALGSSSLDHAGMKAFLANHRKDIRGAFVINLDCVGAGSLTVLTQEGLENTRKANRRLVRMLSSTANDLHVDMAQRSYDWNSTDATPAMRSSMRCATIMGVDDAGLPALSRTIHDVPENVSGDQAADVAEIVTELIRRS